MTVDTIDAGLDAGTDADAVLAAGDEGVESLRQQLQEAKEAREAADRARAEAERRAAERDAEARRLADEGARRQGELEDSRLQTIQNAIAASEGTRKDIRARLIAAKTAGDYEAEAEATIELSQVATDLHRLNESKNLLENRIAEEREAAKNPPAPQLPADPVERAVTGMSARAAAWVRSHPEVVTDPVKNAELVLADKLAQRAGIDPASDAYFAHMDSRMGYGGEPASPRRTAPSAPAAPPSRGNDVGAGSSTQIRLTRDQKDMADSWGWTYKQYWENMTPAERARQH